jgi:hypothetical protein
VGNCYILKGEQDQELRQEYSNKFELD